MKWLLAGASGFLGNALRVRLASEGHEVVRLVRREPASSAEFRWDPYADEVDPAAFEGVDAVVNLAGVNLLTRPWTTSRREQILVLPGRRPPGPWPPPWPSGRPEYGERPVFVSQSATGYYGTGGRRAPAHRGLPRRSRLRRSGLRAVGGPDPDRRGGRRTGGGAAGGAGLGPQRQLVPADATGVVVRPRRHAGQRPAVDADRRPVRLAGQRCSGPRTTRTPPARTT